MAPSGDIPIEDDFCTLDDETHITVRNTFICEVPTKPKELQRHATAPPDAAARCAPLPMSFPFEGVSTTADSSSELHSEPSAQTVASPSARADPEPPALEEEGGHFVVAAVDLDFEEISVQNTFVHMPDPGAPQELRRHATAPPSQHVHDDDNEEQAGGRAHVAAGLPLTRLQPRELEEDPMDATTPMAPPLPGALNRLSTFDPFEQAMEPEHQWGAALSEKQPCPAPGELHRWQTLDHFETSTQETGDWHETNALRVVDMAPALTPDADMSIVYVPVMVPLDHGSGVIMPAMMPPATFSTVGFAAHSPHDALQGIDREDKPSPSGIGRSLRFEQGAHELARPDTSGRYQAQTIVEVPVCGATRFYWLVESAKLKSSVRTVVSKQFVVNGLQFVMMLQPHPPRAQQPPQKEGKGMKSFQASKGHGFVQLKCNSEPPDSLEFEFSIGVAAEVDKPEMEPARPTGGRVRHDLAKNNLCGLPKEEQVWNFSSVIGKDSNGQELSTFAVFLEVPNQWQ